MFLCATVLCLGIFAGQELHVLPRKGIALVPLFKLLTKEDVLECGLLQNTLWSVLSVDDNLFLSNS